jgi:hypothetical protein
MMSDAFDETTADEMTVDDARSPLPADVMRDSEGSVRPEDDLPLHLRVLRAIVDGQPTQERIDQALSLANEVYELEASVDLED